jgi:dolichyl-phosphate-mannose--protein O-mannosyl transferase
MIDITAAALQVYIQVTRLFTACRDQKAALTGIISLGPVLSTDFVCLVTAPLPIIYVVQYMYPILYPDINVLTIIQKSL